MSIKKFHHKGCDVKRDGGSCACPWRLDFRTRSACPARISDSNSKLARRPSSTRPCIAFGLAQRVHRPRTSIPTFGAVAAEWMREKSDRHPATLLGWRVILKHLKPLDVLRLDRVTVTVVENLRDDLLEGTAQNESAAS